MEQRCPEAVLLIFTNPITNMVDAVERYTSTRSIGLCPGVYNVICHEFCGLLHHNMYATLEVVG